MAILADTNVLLRLTQPHHPHFPSIERALAALRAERQEFVVTVQNCVEFWAVATRPTGQNGLGMSPQTAGLELAVIREAFAVLPEGNSTLEMWQQLVTACGVSGKSAHDAAPPGLYGLMFIRVHTWQIIRPRMNTNERNEHEFIFSSAESP
jgi:predicted nucleic acid-binding protein